MSDIEKVNTFSRIEKMKNETRSMTNELTKVNKNDYEKILIMCDIYDHLSVDWIHSGKLEWEGSLPSKQARKIIEAANNN